jgi:catechol-2,3-dioxygenase
MPNLATSAPSPRSGEISPAKLAHLVFRTPRYDEMVRWYCTVLGAAPVFADAMLTFATYDDEHHRIAFVNLPQLADLDPSAAGVDHVAFTYRSLGDLLHTYVRLEGLGIRPSWCINHGPTTSMYYNDPDGTRVELQVDNFATEADLDAWFRSGAFAKNPIGVEFDPDELLRLYCEGTPVERLVQQGSTNAP